MGRLSFVFQLSLLLLLCSCSAYGADVYTKEVLTADLRYLAKTIEESHPDPYGGSGGKIAFHRKVYDLLVGIPQKGMNREDFYEHIRPLVASVKDGHTALHPTKSSNDRDGHLPIRFSIVDEGLYVSSVAREKLRPFLGARLLTLNGISTKEMLNKLSDRVGFDNIYHALDGLGKTLCSRNKTYRLLPSQKMKAYAELELLGPNEKSVGSRLYYSAEHTKNWLTPKSKLELPGHQKSDFAFSFMGPQKNVAFLSLLSMTGYREQLEFYRAVGRPWQDSARKAYLRFHGKAPPDNADATLAGTPALSEIFVNLAKKMKLNSATALIVDLRNNHGGFSLATMIFLHVFAGVHKLPLMNVGYQINRYSKLYFDNNKRLTLPKINKGRSFPLNMGDYDFSGIAAFEAGLLPKGEELMERATKLVPTYAKLTKTIGKGPLFEPSSLYVLTSAATYSSGFDLALTISRLGGRTVGTPSAQAGNCFINSLSFELPHSKIGGTISSKYSVKFPGAADGGKVHQPDQVVTYEDLFRNQFDPHTSLSLVLRELQ